MKEISTGALFTLLENYLTRKKCMAKILGIHFLTNFNFSGMHKYHKIKEFELS